MVGTINVNLEKFIFLNNLGFFFEQCVTVLCSAASSLQLLITEQQ